MDKRQKRPNLDVRNMYGIRLAGDFSGLWTCRWILLFAQRGPIRLLRARLLQNRSRKESMDESTYEKSLDKRCAALVSREPRAPRAGQNCKSHKVNGLRLMSLLTRARAAQMSRADPGSNTPLAARFIGRFLPFATSQERRPPESGGRIMQHRQNAKNVAFCCILLHGVAPIRQAQDRPIREAQGGRRCTTLHRPCGLEEPSGPP